MQLCKNRKGEYCAVVDIYQGKYIHVYCVEKRSVDVFGIEDFKSEFTLVDENK